MAGVRDSFLLQRGTSVVMAGDSITDAGFVWGGIRPHGDGYVRMVADLVAARYPGRDVRFTNAGVGGITSRQVRDRWPEHVLAPRPAWATLMIGINDCGGVLAGSDDAPRPPLYEQFLREMVEQASDAGIKVVLLDSFYLRRPEEASAEERTLLDLLAEYLDVVERVSAEYSTLHIRTHALFQEQLAHRPSTDFCTEPVHPNQSGHLVIAHALLQGLSW